MTSTGYGALQQPAFDGETDSQLPPEVVLATGVKRRAPLVVAMVTICGSGLAPAKGIVNDIAGTVWNVWEWSGLGSPKIKAKTTVAKKIPN